MSMQHYFWVMAGVVLGVSSSWLIAQDRPTESGFNPAQKQSAYEEYVRQQKAGFNRYQEEHRKFLSQLKQEWQDYKAMQALVRDQVPKLPTAPIRKNSKVRPIEQPQHTPEIDLPILDLLGNNTEPFVEDIVNDLPITTPEKKVDLPTTVDPLMENQIALPTAEQSLPETQVGLPSTESDLYSAPTLPEPSFEEIKQPELSSPEIRLPEPNKPVIAEQMPVEPIALPEADNRVKLQPTQPPEVVASSGTSSQIKQEPVATQPMHVKEEGFIFYGQRVVLPALPDIKLTGNDEKSLQNYWAANAQANYEPILQAFEQTKTELVLSDWAVYLLAQMYIKQQYKTENQIIAASWFLLNNLGYETRIANGDQSLILMMTTQQTLFGVPYYPIGDKRYYHLAGAVSKNIRSYAGEFSRNNQPLDMRFNKTLKTVAAIQYRTVKTRIAGEELTLKLPYDLQRINYLATYPQLELRYYFVAPVDPVTAKGLQAQVPTLLAGSKDKQASQLLHFIHESFPYAVDRQQFGRENYLTVEESLHYQASDCEDRSILFAWLAKSLLQEPVVALEYEGHVATALTRGGRLVSADPTYIGADLGDIMPNLTGLQPKVIRF